MRVPAPDFVRGKTAAKKDAREEGGVVRGNVEGEPAVPDTQDLAGAGEAGDRKVRLAG